VGRYKDEIKADMESSRMPVVWHCAILTCRAYINFRVTPQSKPTSVCANARGLKGALFKLIEPSEPSLLNIPQEDILTLGVKSTRIALRSA
jgi:hypothetical protein